MSESQQYLYRIQPTRPEMLSDAPTDEESKIVTDHFNYLKTLAAQGVIILAGRTLTTDERSFGIVILQADDQDSAQDIVNNDPAVKHGVMQAELFPYRVAVTGKFPEN